MLESPSNFNLKKHLAMWPENVDLNELIFFMRVRLFLGAAFFSALKNERKLKSQENDIYLRYIDSIKLLENLDINSQFL